MRNPAMLAAELSGRVLLMRETALSGYARALGVAMVGDEKRNGFAGLMGRARRALAAKPEAPEDVAAPQMSAPVWMGDVEYHGFGWALKDGIATFEIRGPMMAEGFGWGDTWYHGYDTMLLAYEEMAADARVKAIFTRFNTNGGVCDDGLPQLAKFLRSIRASAGGKPHWAYVHTGYSAGYYVIAQCDYVVCARGGGVGSIGAVVGHCDMSGSLEQDGIKYRAFKFGAKKTDGSSLEPLSESAAEDLQAEIDQQGRWFVADVHAGRPSLSVEAILATEAGCFFGDSDVPELSGLQNGLVDAVMSEREAFEALRAQISGQSDPLKTPSGVPIASQEREMKRSEVMAAAGRANLSEEDRSRLEAELPSEEVEDEDGGEDEQPADDENDDEPEETAPADDASATSLATAQAILALPEAKGRDKLAKTLAFKPGMSVAEAKTILSAAGKESSLSTQMEGRDPPLSPTGGQRPVGEAAGGRALAERFNAMRRGPKKSA